MKDKQEKYNGWLQSTNIFKRSLAVWGHMTFGYITLIIIFLALYAVAFMIGFIVGVFS